MTLTEVLVTIAVMILLFAFTMPAVRAIKASLGAADELPIILGFARTAAMREQGYAGCAVVTQANGEVWAFLLIPDDSHVYTPAEDAIHAIALKTGEVGGVRFKPRRIADDYSPAYVLYNKQGECCPHRNLVVDGAPQKSVEKIAKGGVDRYLHRYEGGFIR
jgi:Tfp pilus assembly protein FimT